MRRRGEKGYGSVKGQTPLRTQDIHGLLLAVRESVAKTYSLRDPRAGLRLTDLLTRLGSLDLLEMFPKKQFIHARDLHALDQEALLKVTIDPVLAPTLAL